MVRIRLGDLIEKDNLKIAGHIDRDLPQWLGVDDLSFEFPVLIDAAMITHIGKPELMPEMTIDLWESVEKAMNERPVGQLTIRNWGTDDEPYYQIEALTIEYGGQQPKTTIVYREGEMPEDFVSASESPTGKATWTRPSLQKTDSKSESQSFLSENLKPGKCGYIDKTGRVIIATQLDEIIDLENFHEGLARVKVGGKWGYIDKTGKMVIEPIGMAYSFHEGLAVVKVGNKCGYIDKTGQMVIEPQFETAYFFQEGLAAVEIGGKWGYIDTTGQMVIEPQFESADSFQEGLAKVKVGGKRGYIDKVGQMVIDGSAGWSLGSFQEGLASVKVGDEWGYIDKTGQMVIEPHLDHAYPFQEGFAGVYIDDKWGYIDATGQMVIEPQFENSYSFQEELASVKVGDKWGYIDTTGQMVIEPHFEDTLWFQE